MRTKETILITGASGFIGGWLAETLYLRELANVRAGIRSWSSAARLARFPIEIVLCDVLERSQIAQAMQDATMVVHCAMGAREVTVQGTKNVLDVALRQHLKRFIHLSTIEVYGDVSGKIDETSPFQYTGREYGDAKIEAEKYCWEYYAQGVPLTVLRPSIVYGPFSEDWIIRIAQKLMSRNWGMFEGYGEGMCNLVYVADLISGICAVLEREQTIGEVFNINGSELITWNQYFERFNAALELPELRPINPIGSKFRAAILQPTKSSAKYILSHLDAPLKRIYERYRWARKLMQVAEQSIKTTASFTDLNLYNRNAIYTIGKAQDLLEFVPRYDLNLGLQLSIAWLKHLGLVEDINV